MSLFLFRFQAYDDVERKVKPKENPFEYKKRVMLDQEKSKLSLGEIYEQEYLEKIEVRWLTNLIVCSSFIPFIVTFPF